MSKCSFLSTNEKKVVCFKECPFYNYADTDGVCPFKCLESEKNWKNNFGYSDLFESQNVNILDELYREKNYYNIFQI